jgi:TolB-like protein
MVRCLVALAMLFAPTMAAARTIAIAYFDNNTGHADLDPLRKGLADMLITDLGNVGSLQIVERDKLNQVLDELKLSKSKFIDPKTAQKLGKGLAAEFIMTGGYVVAGDTLRVDVRVVEVATGKVAASEKVEGKTADFFSIEKDLVDILVKTLDVKLSTSERGKLRSNATESFDAWQKYDALARRMFQAALDADPNYRAAKSATERLQVIFQRTDAAKAAEIDKTWKSLDPKAPDFAQKVDTLLSQLVREEPAQLQQKVALLSFLAERELTPTLQGGFSRIPLEVMALLWIFDGSPEAATLLPPVCEYLISRFPKDQSVQGQCKQLLKIIDMYAKQDPAQLKQHWEDEWKSPTLDWQLSEKAALPSMEKLFRLYAKKLKRP